MYSTDLHKNIHFTCKACLVTQLCVYSSVYCFNLMYKKASLSEGFLVLKSSHVHMLQLHIIAVARAEN